MAYQSTRLQYRVLTEGLPPAKTANPAAKPRFEWMSLIDRTAAGVTLPLAATVETLFLPVTYGYTVYLNHFHVDEYPLTSERTGMLSRTEPTP